MSINATVEKCVKALIKKAEKHLKMALEKDMYGQTMHLQGYIAGLERAKAIIEANKEKGKDE